MLPGTNLTGFVALAAGGGAALALETYTPVKQEGLLTMVFGVCATVLSLAWLWAEKRGVATEQGEGPKVLFLPAWVIGVFWIALGAIRWFEVIP